MLFSQGRLKPKPLGSCIKQNSTPEEYLLKMTHIEIPHQFHRNSSNVLALGVETTGSTLINCGNELLDCSDLSGKDVLDIGCGVRFTQTIINRDLPIKSYTGIDIDESSINYLINNVQDSRFSFYYWHVYNEMYNTTGQRLTKRTRLPLLKSKKFDVIWMYSVITHNYPPDTQYLLSILRRHIKKDGGLLFSAFLDNTIDTFEDRLKDQPLSIAYYNETFLRRLISKAGWQVESLYNKRPDAVVQNLFLCRPKRHFGKYFSYKLR
jgi:2-polyprenyl-3-methyl-5-hydroxy-6-metoxy-1,4-benzoquinol methylase